MAQFAAVLMHGKRGGEGRYEFAGRDDLLDDTPVRIMRAFMESVEARNGIGHMDYEINAALKNKDHGVVTVIGDIIFDHANRQPFMCMISRV
jgi:hypothetical protein